LPQDSSQGKIPEAKIGKQRREFGGEKPGAQPSDRRKRTRSASSAGQRKRKKERNEIERAGLRGGEGKKGKRLRWKERPAAPLPRQRKKLTCNSEEE